MANLNELAQIGATPEGGVTRLAFSEADVAGRLWFEQKVKAAGLRYEMDGAGNQFGILPAFSPTKKLLLCGSHLDTVPNGGKYDGALGTLSALEVVQTIKEANLDLPYDLGVVNFTDEEGSVMSLFGSHAVAGQLTADHFTNLRSGTVDLVAGMARLGITQESALAATIDPDTLVGFVEIHIEQGVRLENAGISIGIVTSIVGIRSAWLTFGGEAAHAGAKPMADRRDAMWGATAFVQRAKALVESQFHPGVCNFGQLFVEPGAFNIVPAKVKLALEYRHGTEPQMDDMRTALFDLAQTIATEYGLTLQVEEVMGCISAPSDEKVVQVIEDSAEKLGLSSQRLISFAGHDTQSMAAITPSAMIFVPSVNGVSHHYAEYTKDADCVNGANVMLHTLLSDCWH
jgi:N-carbamoyl-L-amino-acid hydrolase